MDHPFDGAVRFNQSILGFKVSWPISDRAVSPVVTRYIVSRPTAGSYFAPRIQSAGSNIRLRLRNDFQ